MNKIFLLILLFASCGPKQDPVAHRPALEKVFNRYIKTGKTEKIVLRDSMWNLCYADVYLKNSSGKSFSIGYKTSIDAMNECIYISLNMEVPDSVHVPVYRRKGEVCY